MAAERGLPATWIVRVVEVIVPPRVCPELWIIDVWRQHQRSTTAPTANQLCGEQFLFGFRLSMRPKESIECPDPGLVFAKADVSAVATEYVRLRHRQRNTRFTRIS